MSKVRQVDGGQSVRALATHLNSPARAKPVVVVSVAAATPKPYIDPDEIVNAVGDLADVYLIRTGQDTWMFTDNMPEHTQVYGGAGRAYPVGTGWVTNPRHSPLRFAFDATRGKQATRLLVTDALHMANEAGLTSPRQQRTTVRRSGEVRGIATSDRAMVRLSTGDFATIVQEMTLPDVSLDRVVAVGMTVAGLHDAASGRLDIRAELLAGEQALRHYEVGDVVLAQVKNVGPDEARLLLHPEVAVAVRRDEVTSNDLDELTSLMTEDEVLTARVVATGPAWRLSLIDVEDDEVPRPAASLLPGGPPWLETYDELPLAEPGARVPDEMPAPLDAPLPPSAPVIGPEPEPTPILEPAAPSTATPPWPTPALLDRRRAQPSDAAPPDTEPSAPAPPRERPTVALESLSLALDAARTAQRTTQEQRDRLSVQVRALQGELALAASHIDTLTRQRDHKDQQLKQSRASRRKAARRPSADAESAQNGVLFLDPEQQFRFDVHQAWARRIPAGEKAARPLGDYAIGPEFQGSVDAITGISRDKIVDVVVELATGLALELDSREVHQLRTSEGGNSRQVTRPSDGAGAWRVSLQRDAPQARRLHFWRQHAGTIELSRVALHDDYTP